MRIVLKFCYVAPCLVCARSLFQWTIQWHTASWMPLPAFCWGSSQPIWWLCPDSSFCYHYNLNKTGFVVFIHKFIFVIVHMHISRMYRMLFANQYTCTGRFVEVEIDQIVERKNPLREGLKKKIKKFWNFPHFTTGGGVNPIWNFRPFFKNLPLARRLSMASRHCTSMCFMFPSDETPAEMNTEHILGCDDKRMPHLTCECWMCCSLCPRLPHLHTWRPVQNVEMSVIVRNVTDETRNPLHFINLNLNIILP